MLTSRRDAWLYFVGRTSGTLDCSFPPESLSIGFGGVSANLLAVLAVRIPLDKVSHCSTSALFFFFLILWSPNKTPPPKLFFLKRSHNRLNQINTHQFGSISTGYLVRMKSDHTRRKRACDAGKERSKLPSNAFHSKPNPNREIPKHAPKA
jgi:hypothetical protein